MRVPPGYGPAAALLATILLAGAGEAPAQPVRLTASGQLGPVGSTIALIDSTEAPGSGARLGSGALLVGNLGLRLPSGFGLEVSAAEGLGLGLEGTTLAAKGADLSTLTAHAFYEAQLAGTSAIAPFVGAGAGVRRVSFTSAPEGGPSLEEQSDLVGVALFGLYLRGLPLGRLRFEARSYLSTFQAFGQSNLQHDVALFAGLAVTVP